MKKLKLTKSEILKALKEVAFTPSANGPMKIIMDVGELNVDYYVKRAKEELALADESLGYLHFIKHLDNALQLIAIAKVSMGRGTKPWPVDES